MNPMETLQQLSQQMMSQMPEPVRQLSEQAQAQMKSVVQQNLAQLNLVTREEFEAQSRLLEAAEQRIAALEARLNEAP